MVRSPLKDYFMKMLREISLSALLFISLIAGAQRSMENLDSGVAAVRTADRKVLVSWRLFGTEPNDLAFNLYCTVNGRTRKLNGTPIDKVTSFLDNDADTVAARN